MTVTFPLRVGLIGVGGIARDQHLPAWKKLPGVQLTAAADTSPTQLAAVANQFEIPFRTSDWRVLLDRPDVDVVDICVPNTLHAPVTLAALAAGKHVLCEKPMATCAADALAMCAAAKQAGKQLMINQHLRFDPVTTRLRTLDVEQHRKQTYYARAQWLRRRRLPGRPTFVDKSLSGGGPMYDLGVHLLDLAWWMMECPTPVSVSATVSAHLAKRTDLGSEWGTWDPAKIDVEDFAAAFIRFAGGAVLSLETSWLLLQSQPEITRLEWFSPHVGLSWPDGVLVGERNQTPYHLQLDSCPAEPAHHEAIRQFALAIVENRPVPIPPEQCAQVIAMLDAMYLSSERQREVVM